jgi:putative Holliday junction resolvase
MRALGVDYGGRRIGLALSDPTGLLARPWKTLPRVGNPLQVARAIAAEIDALGQAEESVHVLVLGYPRRLNGGPNDQTPKVLELAEQLRAVVTVPVVLQDERLTSREADERLAVREKDWRRRKEQLDAMAAAVLLQDYLDAQPRDANGREQEGRGK